MSPPSCPGRDVRRVCASVSAIRFVPRAYTLGAAGSSVLSTGSSWFL
jgi:hypothetical protein